MDDIEPKIQKRNLYIIELSKLTILEYTSTVGLQMGLQILKLVTFNYVSSLNHSKPLKSLSLNQSLILIL